MTKIKNTKKGMAKKTLSISLAVAMLATSNVPVWAAEDLFTDGEVAVEAFTAEEVVEEAPVVEEEVDVPAVKAVDSEYTVDFKDFKAEYQWGVTKYVKVKVTDSVTGAVDTSKMKFRFVDANGNVVDEEYYGGEHSFGATDAEGYASVPLTFNHDHVGQTFSLQVYKNLNADWIVKSPAMTVAKREIHGDITFNNPVPVYYTGKQATIVPDTSNWTIKWDAENVDMNELTIENFTAVGEDTINSNYVSGEELTAVGEVVSKYYTGTASSAFKIERVAVASVDNAVKVELPKYTYQYTGNPIEVGTPSITVTNKYSEEVVANAVVKKYTIDKNVGVKSDKVDINMGVGSLKNFLHTENGVVKEFTADTSKATPAETVTVTKRDLADTTNTMITVHTVTQDLLQNSTINAENLKNNLEMRDASGALINNNEVTLSFDGKNTLAVESGKTYSVTVKGNTDNFVNERTVEFKVVAHDLNEAKFVNEDAFFKDRKVQEYTGKPITFGLTAANLTEKLGELKYKGTTLSKGKEYDANVVFDENTNVGMGKIIIVGKEGFEGSQKEIPFLITARVVSQDAVVVPKKVLFNENIREAAEYGIVPELIVKGKDECGNDIELTVPASDYTVDYSFLNENKVNHMVRTAVSDNTNGNFVFASKVLYGNTRIGNKEITAEDIQMEKTEYTYTGKPIVPDYTVVVDGVTLEKGTDYREVVTHNTNVGEATLTITGKGDYENTSVSKKFEIVAANTSDLTIKSGAVYTGNKHDDAAELSLFLDDFAVNRDEFDFYFPTSKLANINAGDAIVTLVPKKTNKNFVGEHEFTFTIAQAELKGGELKAYDAKGTRVDINKAVNYDGTAHTFASVVYTNNNLGENRVLTENDYEIIYRDNVTGNNHKGHVIVVAKGNYKNTTGKYTCADKSVVENVVVDEAFEITPIELNKKHTVVTVEDGAYKGGLTVSPEVTVTYKGKELVEGADYVLDYDAYQKQNRIDVTNGKTLKVDVVGIGGYEGAMQLAWGITKFDLANANVIVSGTDAEPVVKVMNDTVLVDPSNYEMTVADGKVTVTATKDNKHYEGTQTVEIKEALEKPVAPMIERVDVTGNKATVVLSGETEGAIGYDYVIATGRDCIDTKVYDKVNKNKLTTDTTFQYVEQGMYYAYCHAWTRDENGKKVFSDWSNAYPFSVTAITPAQPTITSVTQKGSTVTVTYTESANATGYDVVLGSAMATVNNERRPVDYGTLVEKNATTTTVTFKDVPAGTYYVGLHSYNRTSEDGKKVFSPWSVAKTFKVK